MSLDELPKIRAAESGPHQSHGLGRPPSYPYACRQCTAVVCSLWDPRVNTPHFIDVIPEAYGG
jgi:hypothetical protein